MEDKFTLDLLVQLRSLNRSQTVEVESPIGSDVGANRLRLQHYLSLQGISSTLSHKIYKAYEDNGTLAFTRKFYTIKFENKEFALYSSQNPNSIIFKRLC